MLRKDEITVDKESFLAVREIMRQPKKAYVKLFSKKFGNESTGAIVLTEDNRFKMVLYNEDQEIIAEGDEERDILEGEWDIGYENEIYALTIVLTEEAMACERRKPAPEISTILSYISMYYEFYPKYSAEWIIEEIGRTIKKNKFDEWKASLLKA